jgi:hypothetical protein
MSATSYMYPLNMNLFELLNAVVQNVATEPAAGKQGRIIYNTATKKLGVDNGTSWDYVGAGNITASDVSNIIQAAFLSSDYVTLTWDATNKRYTIGTTITANAAAATPSLRALGTGATQAAAGNDARLSDTRTPTDGTVTNAKVATGAAISADKLANGTTNVVMLATERTKLAGVAAGATANQADSYLLNRANHTGTQTVSTISDFGTAVDAKISAVVNGAPGTLDTLKELADALGDDPNFATTITNLIATKANSADLKTVATTGSFLDLTNRPGYAVTIGDGAATAFVVTHAKNTYDVTWDVYDMSTKESVGVKVIRSSVNAVTVTFGTAPAANSYRVVVNAAL